MASKRKSLSVVEFLEDVCADDEPTQSQDYTFDEVLKTSVASFRVLSGEFEDYGRFREAAKRSLTACYEQHRKGAKPQEQILNSSVPVRPMIQSEVRVWLKFIRRRMSTSQKARDPWTVNFKRDMPEELFCYIRDTILAARSNYGIESSEPYKIVFRNENRFSRDFSKLSGFSRSELKDSFKNSFSGRKKGWRTELLVGESEPFSVAFNVKKMQLTVKCHYGCWNEFGYGFHG